MPAAKGWGFHQHSVTVHFDDRNRAEGFRTRRKHDGPWSKGITRRSWSLGSGRWIKRVRQSGSEPTQDLDALIHDPFARCAGLDLVLQVEKNGAVLLKLIAVEV